MKNSKISWTHHTVNFWWGCTKVSPACAACYALAIARMWKKGKVGWGPTGLRWIRTEAALEELRKLEASAAKRGARERVFINSMSDTFEVRDDLNEARAQMFAVFEGLKHLDVLLLTKRPEEVMNMVPASWRQQWPSHVLIGTTVEDQQRANERLPLILQIPAAVRFLSCEPLLEYVVLGQALEHIQWVIVGGESGAAPRPIDAAWVRSIRDECLAAGVPFFFKQWGGRGAEVKKNGNRLDGRKWERFPRVRRMCSPKKEPHAAEVSCGTATLVVPSGSDLSWSTRANVTDRDRSPGPNRRSLGTDHGER